MSTKTVKPSTVMVYPQQIEQFGRPGGLDNPLGNQAVTMTNSQKGPFEIIKQNGRLANHSDSANENPGALAGATGADLHTTNIDPTNYRKRAESATTLCLAIANCDPQDACEIMEAALIDLGTGQPRVPLFSLMEAATDWADFAVKAEIKAYALACFNRMSPAERTAFLAYVGRCA